MRFMISQPMGGLSDEEIKSKQKQATDLLQQLGHEVIDTYFEMESASNTKNRGLHYLGYSLIEMATCDAVYFCSGWETAKGCKIEHEAAISYGMQIMYEKED